MPEVAQVAVSGCLVNGEWLTTGATADVRSPYDGSVVGKVAIASRADLERAIEASVRSFEHYTTIVDVRKVDDSPPNRSRTAGEARGVRTNDRTRSR